MAPGAAAVEVLAAHEDVSEGDDRHEERAAAEDGQEQGATEAGQVAGDLFLGAGPGRPGSDGDRSGGVLTLGVALTVCHVTSSLRGYPNTAL